MLDLPNRWMAIGRVGVVILLGPLLLFSMVMAFIAGDVGAYFGIGLGFILLLLLSTTRSVVWSVRLGDQLVVRRTFHSSSYQLSEINSVSEKDHHTQFTLVMPVRRYKCIEFSMKSGTRILVLSPGAEKLRQLRERLATHQIPTYW